MSEPGDVETVERVIPAPAEKIFALIADPTRHHDIDGSGTVRECKHTPERLTLGSKFGMKMKMGIPYSMVSEVIEFEDGRLIAWQSRPPSKIGSTIGGGRIWRYELEPTEGGTLVRESWDISQEKIKAIVKPARKRTRENMEKTLARIEELVTTAA
ncbi:MAG: SRPBCC family protein [Acidimicrobiia bacterium]